MKMLTYNPRLKMWSTLCSPNTKIPGSPSLRYSSPSSPSCWSPPGPGQTSSRVSAYLILIEYSGRLLSCVSSPSLR